MISIHNMCSFFSSVRSVDVKISIRFHTKVHDPVKLKHLCTYVLTSIPLHRIWSPESIRALPVMFNRVSRQSLRPRMFRRTFEIKDNWRKKKTSNTLGLQISFLRNLIYRLCLIRRLLLCPYFCSLCPSFSFHNSIVSLLFSTMTFFCESFSIVKLFSTCILTVSSPLLSSPILSLFYSSLHSSSSHSSSCSYLCPCSGCVGVAEVQFRQRPAACF